LFAHSDSCDQWHLHDKSGGIHLKGRKIIKSVLLASLLATGSAIAQTEDLCDEIEVSRTQAVAKAQKAVQQEFDTMQESRNNMQKCMLDLSKTMGPMVSNVSGLSGILSMLGDSLNDEMCREIQNRTQNAMDDLRRNQQKVMQNVNNPGGSGGGMFQNVPGAGNVQIPGLDEGKKNIDEIYKKLMGG